MWGGWQEAGQGHRIGHPALLPAARKSHLRPGPVPETSEQGDSPRTHLTSALSAGWHCCFLFDIQEGGPGLVAVLTKQLRKSLLMSSLSFSCSTAHWETIKKKKKPRISAHRLFDKNCPSDPASCPSSPAPAPPLQAKYSRVLPFPLPFSSLFPLPFHYCLFLSPSVPATLELPQFFLEEGEAHPSGGKGFIPLKQGPGRRSPLRPSLTPKARPWAASFLRPRGPRGPGPGQLICSSDEIPAAGPSGTGEEQETRLSWTSAGALPPSPPGPLTSSSPGCNQTATSPVLGQS